MPDNPEISAVIPCLDEVENAAAIAAAVAVQLREFASSYEIIFIDNGSTDGTVDVVRKLCADDANIKLIVNTQNYGQMRSPTHGIYQATGSAVIGICADFQDPPELLGTLIERWRAGALIVLGVRKSEKTSTLTRWIRAIGYGFFERFGDYRVIPGATGFGLYDRRVVDTVKQWRDPEPFFRGMLVETGFRLETVPYHRPERAGGQSKNHFFTLLSFALSSLASSSKRLLRVPLYFGVLSGLCSVLGMIVAVVIGVVSGPPWILIITSGVGFLFSWVFLFLGLIGEQVRLISEISRNTPLVIEEERVNFL